MKFARKLAKQLRWLPARYWFYVREAMQSKAVTRDPVDGQRYVFVADSLHALQRGREVWVKEPQTVDWLRKTIRPDDVFLDIGANVGTFSIFAAKHLKKGGHVYACEPHLPTTVQLLQNIAANGVGDRVSVVSIAASGKDGMFPFQYKRWRQGASGSQLQVDGGLQLKSPVGTELKLAMRIDSMVNRGLMRSPNIVKIDTDGLEIPIVEGMEGILKATSRPRSVLVEVQTGEMEAQRDQMRRFGYVLAGTHALTQGANSPVNAIFEPETN